MSKHPGIPSGPDPRFEKQKEKLVQLLKNRNDFLARTTRDEDPAAPRPHDPERSGEDSRHRMPINAEVMRRWSDHPASKAFREVERELETIRSLTPFVYRPLYDLFLHPDAGDADYDRLRKKAKSGSVAGKKQLASVEMALYMLTMRLVDRNLYAVFPSRYLPGKRGETMEENYRAIHRIFRQECDHHAKTMKRYRKKAFGTAAALCGCSVSTVERAVHFVESVEEGGSMNGLGGNESKLTRFVLMVFVLPAATIILASLIPLATTLLLTWIFDWPRSSALVAFAAAVIWNLASGNVRAMRLLDESRNREREMHSKASEILNRFASRN